MSAHRDNDPKPEPEKISFVTYRDDEAPSASKPNSERIELFRRAYDANARERPPEREKRIRFEVLDDSPQGQKKRSGFNPYETLAPPKKPGPRR